MSATETEMISDAVEGEQGGASPEPEAPEPVPAGEAAAGEAPESAPAAESWKPPSREEYEEMRRHAEIGREFGPHAEAIRGAFRRGFEPQAPRPPAQAQPKPLDPDDYDKFFASPKGYEEWKASARDDPRAYESGMRAIARRAFKAEFDELKALKEQVGGLGPRLDELSGWAVVAGKRFQENPAWAKYGKSALALVQNGKVTDLDLAFQIAEREALAKGASPAQAAQAGAKVAQVAAAKQGQGAANAASQKPSPRDEPSLKAGAPRGGATVPVDQTKGGGKRKVERNMVEATMRSLGIR